jgi:hypothetical protein
MNGARAGRIAFWVGTVAIFAVAAWLRGTTFGQPIEAGYHDLGLRQAVAARNFLAHGLIETRGAMILNGGPAAPEELEPYARHPTLLPIILAAVFQVFGDSLAAYRATHIGLSLAAIAVLMGILHRTHGRVASLAAGWAAAVCPMSAFFATGGDVLGEGLNLLVLAGIALRIGGGGDAGWGRLASELVFYFLATLYDWPGVFAFGIPLADAVLGARSRRAFGQGAVALAAGALSFGLVYWWAAVLVPGRFPQCALADAANQWTPMRLAAAFREYPDLMRSSLEAFWAAQLVLWGLPLLAAAGIALAWLPFAALRGRFAESGGRPLLLLFVPGVGFAGALTAMFVMHFYAPIVFVPAIAGAAGACMQLLSRLRVAGWILIAAWAAWAGWKGVTDTHGCFEHAKPPGLCEAAVEAAAQIGPDGLIVTYHPTSWALSYYARRNVVANATSPLANDAVSAYRARHPAAAGIYALSPPSRVASFQPAAAHQAEQDRYEAMERALEARARPTQVGLWRLYRIF